MIVRSAALTLDAVTMVKPVENPASYVKEVVERVVSTVAIFVPEFVMLSKNVAVAPPPFVLITTVCRTPAPVLSTVVAFPAMLAKLYRAIELTYKSPKESVMRGWVSPSEAPRAIGVSLR